MPTSSSSSFLINFVNATLALFYENFLSLRKCHRTFHARTQHQHIAKRPKVIDFEKVSRKIFSGRRERDWKTRKNACDSESREFQACSTPKREKEFLRSGIKVNRMSRIHSSWRSVTFTDKNTSHGCSCEFASLFRLQHPSAHNETNILRSPAAHTSPIPDETRESTESTEEFFLDPEAEKSSLERTHSQPDARRENWFLCAYGKSLFCWLKKTFKKVFFVLLGWLNTGMHVCVDDKEGKIFSKFRAYFLHQKAFFLDGRECLIVRAWNGITNICVVVVVSPMPPSFGSR